MSGRCDGQSASGWRAALPSLGLAALVLGFLIERGVWPGQALTGNSVDLRYYFLPLYEITFGAMASGRLPLWNPNHLTGVPWLATLQAGTFYPPHAVYLLLPIPMGIAISHAAHLVLIAVSTAGLGRKIGLAPAASLLAGGLFALSGTLQWWLFWPNMLEAGAWLPLGCIAVVGLSRGEGPRAGCVLASAAGMSLLAGHTQVTVFLFYAWASLLLALRIGSGGEARGELSRAGFFAGALILGGFISGVQTLPSFALALEGTRSAAALGERQAASLGIHAIGSIPEAMAGGRLAFGAMPLVLAPLALWARRRRRLSVWAFAVGIVATALAFGSGTPLMDLYLALPGIGWFRQPHRLLFLAHFAAALLAALAFDELLHRSSGTDRTRPRSILPAVAVAWALLLAAIALGAGALGAATRALAAALALAACAWRPRWLPLGLSAAGVLAVASVDVMLAPGLREPLPYTHAWSDLTPRNDDPFRNLAAVSGEDRSVWLPFRVDSATKLAIRHGLRRLDDFEPLNLRRHSEYFSFLQDGARSAKVPADLFFSGTILPRRQLPGDRLVEWYAEMATRRRLLDLAAARWFVVPAGLRTAQREATRGFIEAAGLVRREFADPGALLYENQRSLPRAYVSYRTAPAPPRIELLDRLSRESFDPLAVSYVEGDPGFVPDPRAPARGAAARIVRDEETRVEIEADLAAPGLLVLADAYARGWRARVDDEAAPVLVTNFLYRGVPVPAGRHRIRFDYRPRSVPLGAAASVLGTALLALLAFRAGIARREVPL